MTEQDLADVERAVAATPKGKKLMTADRGVLIPVAVIVVCIIAAMSIPLLVLQGQANSSQRETRAAQAVVEDLRCENDRRAARASEQAAAVAEVLDSFAQLLLAGTRGQPPASVIPKIEAAQRRLAAAVADGDSDVQTTCQPTN